MKQFRTTLGVIFLVMGCVSTAIQGIISLANTTEIYTPTGVVYTSPWALVQAAFLLLAGLILAFPALAKGSRDDDQKPPRQIIIHCLEIAPSDDDEPDHDNENQEPPTQDKEDA